MVESPPNLYRNQGLRYMWIILTKLLYNARSTIVLKEHTWEYGKLVRKMILSRYKRLSVI